MIAGRSVRPSRAQLQRARIELTRAGRRDEAGREPRSGVGAPTVMGWKSSNCPIRGAIRRNLRSRWGKKNLGSAGALGHQEIHDIAHASERLRSLPRAGPEMEGGTYLDQ